MRLVPSTIWCPMRKSSGKAELPPKEGPVRGWSAGARRRRWRERAEASVRCERPVAAVAVAAQRQQQLDGRARRAGEVTARRTRSRSALGELTFSVGHVERLLREGHYAQRLSSSAPVFLAAILEYLTAKILELAGMEAQKSGRRRITPELVDMAVHNNALLSGFFGTITISQVAPARE
ncbi:histone H2A-Bbd type 2/3-like [Dugong dugon]